MSTEKKKRVYSHYTKDAALLLGKDIELARKARKLTAHDFADRVGISRITLKKIERGDLKCELGLVLEAAALAGVKLFDVDPHGQTFARSLERVSDKLALLPKSVRARRKEVDDEF